MKRYTESHEWVVIEKQAATVGITDFAQSELGEIVHVELPVVGQRAEAGAEVAVLESTKAAVDVYSPLSGLVTAVNEKLRERPQTVNDSAETAGWLYQLQVEEPNELDDLLNEEGYRSLVS